MNIYLLEGSASGYGTYDACIVIAESEEAARKIHPDHTKHNQPWIKGGSWAKTPGGVDVLLLGTLADSYPFKDEPVILASFIAG